MEDFQDVEAAAAAGAPGVHQHLHRTGRKLGRMLSSVVGMLDLEALVIDGSLGAAAEPFTAGVRDAIVDTAFPSATARLDVLVGELGDQATLRGALQLAIESVSPRPLDDVAPARPGATPPAVLALEG